MKTFSKSRQQRRFRFLREKLRLVEGFFFIHYRRKKGGMFVSFTVFRSGHIED